MRRELLTLRGEPSPQPNRRLDLVMQVLERRLLLDAGPHGLHAIAAGEVPDARELQLEAGARMLASEAST